MRRAWLLATVLLVACESSDDEAASLLRGLRVLAVEATPPEIAVGQQSQVVALIVDDEGLPPPTVTWQACLRAPLPGQSVNPDCVTQSAGDFLQAIGDGPAITVTMPNVAREMLGLPDSTGGVYLTLVARVVGARDRVDATYRLRLADALPANMNPTLTAILAGDTPLDEAASRPVRAGDKIVLGSVFADGSAETYAIPQAGSDGAPPRQATELLTTSWFTTSGVFSAPRTSDTQPTTELQIDDSIAPGTIISLYAVGRDERGGTHHLRRTLVVQ